MDSQGLEIGRPVSVERVWRLLDSDTHTTRKLTAATFLLVYCIYTGELDLGRQRIGPFHGESYVSGVNPDARRD